jgi:hypothetical protein
MLPGSAGRGASLVDPKRIDLQDGLISTADNLPGAGVDEQFATVVEQASSNRFAVIGDYGQAGDAERDVADLVKSWHPEIIVTTGDNNYNDGAAETVDENVGQYFHDFIYPYKGTYGNGAQVNRFFPSLGNHDWDTVDADNLPYPYLDYFTLPGNERYYDFTWGPVHFFVIDSDPHEPDGCEWDSVQANWLQTRLSNSFYQWKIVVLHHPPYSSGERGSVSWMQKWPFADWGADVVLAGHDHTYERISPPGDILYFVNGLGGKSKYNFLDDVVGSQVKYNEDYGAMLVDVSLGKLRFQFINRQEEMIDDFSLVKPIEYLYMPILQQTSP